MKTLSVLLTLIVAMALSWLSGKPAVAQSAPIERQWNMEGVKREAILYVPANATREKVPVVFAFHGHGGSMRQAARSFDYQTVWPEAIIVYMQGLNTPGRLTDPTGTRAGWQSSPGELNDRDLKFFDVVLASLKSDYKVDESRVFATGHSNGGSFTYLLWATRGSIFRAVAPSSAIPVGGARELKPKPVLHLAGEQDPLVRYAWQQRAMDMVKRLDSCDTTGTSWAKAGPLTGTEYPSKTGNPVVTLIHPGGHRFPAEAPTLIVRFFKESSSSR